MNETARRLKLQPAIDGVQGLIDRAFFEAADPMQKVNALAKDINEDYLPALVLRCYQAYECALAENDETDIDKARIGTTAYLASEFVSEAFGRFIVGGEEVPSQMSERGKQLIAQLKGVSPADFSSIQEIPTTKTMVPVRLSEVLTKVTLHQAPDRESRTD